MKRCYSARGPDADRRDKALKRLASAGSTCGADEQAHLLIPDEPTPIVAYETVFALHDAAEQMVVGLYQVCDRGKPRFPDYHATPNQARQMFLGYLFCRNVRC